MVAVKAAPNVRSGIPSGPLVQQDDGYCRVSNQALPPHRLFPGGVAGEPVRAAIASLDARRHLQSSLRAMPSQPCTHKSGSAGVAQCLLCPESDLIAAG
jgi:hypothetical protein